MKANRPGPPARKAGKAGRSACLPSKATLVKLLGPGALRTGAGWLAGLPALRGELRDFPLWTGNCMA